MLSATAARMSAFNAFSSILSPSWKSMARLVLPSRLALKRPEGSLSEAPLAKVNFTLSLYVSPVQMRPACSHTGTPNIAFDGFLHFTSSTTSGSASLMRLRTRASVWPRQSPSLLILASISREGESAPFVSFAPLFVFFMVAAPDIVPGAWYHPVSFPPRCLMGLSLDYQSPSARSKPRDEERERYGEAA